jgi:hypothetical protein
MPAKPKAKPRSAKVVKGRESQAERASLALASLG